LEGFIDMNALFGRIVIVCSLVLLTVWLDERLYDWEKRNIELFRAASTSVVYITTEQVRFSPFRGASVAQGARASSGTKQGTWSPTFTSSRARTRYMFSCTRAVPWPPA
jgi:hypothetical protein